MRPKLFLLILALSVIVITSFLTFLFNDTPNKLSKSEIDTAINQAKLIYSQKKAISQDFSEGPCLTEALMPDWVVDISHNPRQSIDDLPQNQCLSYIEGRAKHFVELDLEGNLIRAQ